MHLRLGLHKQSASATTDRYLHMLLHKSPSRALGIDNSSWAKSLPQLLIAAHISRVSPSSRGTMACRTQEQAVLGPYLASVYFRLSSQSHAFHRHSNSMLEISILREPLFINLLLITSPKLLYFCNHLHFITELTNMTSATKRSGKVSLWLEC